MSIPYVAEIRIFGFDFAPKGWAHCDGQLMPISQNTALFALLGTVYGGDGKTTFALPDLRGAAPMHAGDGVGLSPRDLGESGGSEITTLLEAEIAAHNHALFGSTGIASSQDGTGKVWGRPFGGGNLFDTAGPAATLDPSALLPAGGSQPHNNMQPYLTLNFCIALQGVFPERNS